MVRGRTGGLFLFRVITERHFIGQIPYPDFPSTAVFQTDSDGSVSFYSSERFTAEEAFSDYLELTRRIFDEQGRQRSQPVGVLAISVEECEELGLGVDFDDRGFVGHVSVYFTGMDRIGRQDTRTRMLKLAVARGWSYKPAESMQSDSQLN